MDQSTDKQGRQHGHKSLTIRDNHAGTSRGQINMVDSRHRIFLPVGNSDPEWDKRRDLQMLADITNHTAET